MILSGLLMQSRLKKALDMINCGMYPQAATELSGMLHTLGEKSRKKEKYRPILFYLAECYITMGDEKVENKDLEGALEDFEKAAALKVPFPDLFFRIGSAYRVLENSEKAETALKHAIQLNGRYVKARLLLADLYGSLNQTDQAIHEYQLLYDQDVMHDEERYMMGMRFIDEGDMTKACEALKESFQEKPDRVHVHFVKAKKLFNQKEYAGAIDELNQAMAENRDYPDMYNFWHCLLPERIL